MKRSAEAAGLGPRVSQEPASTSGTGPFIVYFPSRFEPNGDTACQWQAYAHKDRRNQYVLVAETVGGLQGSGGGPRGPPCRCRRRRRLAVARAPLAASPPLLLQKQQVDFVGSTSNPEYSSALPCRCAAASSQPLGTRCLHRRRRRRPPAAKVRRRPLPRLVAVS